MRLPSAELTLLSFRSVYDYAISVGHADTMEDDRPKWHLRLDHGLSVIEPALLRRLSFQKRPRRQTPKRLNFQLWCGVFPDFPKRLDFGMRTEWDWRELLTPI
jgi:hypothetical protein